MKPVREVLRALAAVVEAVVRDEARLVELDEVARAELDLGCGAGDRPDAHFVDVAEEALVADVGVAGDVRRGHRGGEGGLKCLDGRKERPVLVELEGVAGRVEDAGEVDPGVQRDRGS